MSKQHTHKFCQANSDLKFAGFVFAIAFKCVKKVVNTVLFNLAHYKQRGQPSQCKLKKSAFFILFYTQSHVMEHKQAEKV